MFRKIIKNGIIEDLTHQILQVTEYSVKNQFFLGLYELSHFEIACLELTSRLFASMTTKELKNHIKTNLLATSK